MNKIFLFFFISFSCLANALTIDEWNLLNAAESGYAERTEELIKKGVDINVIGAFGATALDLAIESKNQNLVDLLLKNGARKGNNKHWKIFDSISDCFNVDMDELKSLIKGKEEANATDNDGLTVLELAINCPSLKLEIIDLLLSKGAEIKFQIEEGTDLSQYNGYLAYAVMKGMIKEAEELLKQGLNINAQDTHGQSYLMLATKEGQKEIVEFLLKHGADINHSGVFGETALAIARRNKNQQLIDLLVSMDADEGNKTWFIASYLYHPNGATVRISMDEELQAMVKGKEEAEAVIDFMLSERDYRLDENSVNFLLSKGADINFNPGGKTLLMDVASQCAERAMLLLLLKGANPMIKDEEGQNAFDYYKENKCYLKDGYGHYIDVPLTELLIRLNY